MSKISKLQGTSCQIEYVSLKEEDSRRHRSRCVFHKKDAEFACTKYVGVCIGAAHCKYYKEKKKTSESQSKSKSKELPNTSTKSKEKQKLAVERNSTINFNVGCWVEHKDYGYGKILDCSGDIITIDFGKNGIRNMSAQYCTEKMIIRLAKL